MNVGWIGLGAIGTGMVRQLLASDVAVCVYARGQGLAAVTAAGATSSDDYVALASGSDLLTLCLYDDAQVREVLFTHRALGAMRPGSALVIHTTGSPETAREIAGRAPSDVDVLDATFSGGPDDAAEGRLTVMVGGEGSALERARPMLSAYASRILHVGPVGHGQLTKLLNNLMFATNLMHSVEMLHLAEHLGFETWTVADVVQACSGSSYAMGLMASPGRSPSSMLDSARRYMVKDVATALAAASDSNIDVSAFDTVARYFTEVSE